jgi:serine phosphatase RsbU (regulator of sigma subunit)
MFLALAATASQAAAPSAVPVLAIDGLGKGTAELGGPWQFHLGDDAEWAQPQTADATGSGGWEQITTEKGWGAQGHPGYVGYAWYRKHLHLTAAPGAPAQFLMLVRHVDDVYEVYWNGQEVGHNGKMPPGPEYYFSQGAQIVNLGQAGDGVLAVRVWKAPLQSFDPDTLGGFTSAPFAGSPEAILAQKASLDYTWLRNRQFTFALRALDAVVMTLSLLAWFRRRSQKILLAMAAFTGSPVVGLFLTGLNLPLSDNLALGWLQPVLSLQDIGMWFLLLYLLDLDKNRYLMRAAKTLAIISLTTTSLDGGLTLLDWSQPWIASWAQWADGILTAIFTITQMFPWVELGFGLRKRLDASRWVLAIACLLTETLFFLRISADQGSRFTHWTLAEIIGRPLFFINGNAFLPQTITDTLMLLAIIYAVFRYMQDTLRRQGALEQEFKSARELQQVLIPEALPSLPGFAFTSAYRPAAEVGGDFFQVIPLEGAYAGSTLILLGDVSGKGLKAAMTVSMIVGAARTLARFVPRPAELLADLNQRLFGRIQDGFATCLVLRLGPEGQCVMASAGHPAPYLNKKEVDLPGALPLGVMLTASYSEKSIELTEGDHFALYTDGLLEARGANGEIFSFERLDALFATSPDAAKATEAAVDFGQEDDITVLTLTRLAAGEKSSTRVSVPSFSQA